MTIEVAANDGKVNYPAFVNFLGRYPDGLTLLRLRELNIRNLLFYQAELLDLNEQLRGIEDEDAKQNKSPADRISRVWCSGMARSAEQHYPLSTNLLSPDASTKTQSDSPPRTGTPFAQAESSTIHDRYCDKILEIRKTLADYNQALAHYMQQEQLPTPPTKVIQAQRVWLNGELYGNGFLADSSADVWKPDFNGKYHKEDFLTFTSNESIPMLLARAIVAVEGLFPWNRHRGKVASIDTSGQGGIAHGIAVVISCVVPVLPIIILFFVSSLLVRVGLILVFTAVSAAVLVFGFNMTPERVLAVTSALAAIQVVFVGSTSNQLNPS